MKINIEKYIGVFVKAVQQNWLNLPLTYIEE